jgi:hypothetical protein
LSWHWAATHGLIATEVKKGTETVKITITSVRTLQDIITVGTRANGIHTGTATSIARRIITGIGITAGAGTVIAIGIGTIGTTTGTDITGIAMTKDAITASASWKNTSTIIVPKGTATWKSTFIIIIPNAIVMTKTVPASLSWSSIRSSESLWQ